ncbi:hypothetical protein [Ekhidna sp.]
MSEQEIAAFQKQLEADPALKAESDLQGDVIGGLKEYRKLELKSRLDAINVGPTWVEFVQQSALMKSMGGVIVASIIGTGIYFMGESKEEIESTEPITITAPVETGSTDYVLELGDETDVKNDTELEKAVSVAKVENTTDQKPVVQESTPVQSEKLVEVVEKVEEFKPSFDAPAVASVEDESRFSGSDLDELPENTSSESSNEPIDVESENNRSNVIKYKYFDGKLFLSGDFNKSPYEILEINSLAGRRIYVYHQGSYYSVGMANKLTELPLVTNKEVIEELKLLRENK